MKTFRYSILLLILICGLQGISAWSQTPVILPVLASDSRDFGGRVNCIYQDKTGFIWIGKETGLFRFDGLEVKAFHYDSTDSTSIGSDNIQCIAEDEMSNLWIGTKGGGLNRYNRKTNNFTRLIHSENDPLSISYDEIFAILQDEKKNFWLGTDGGGLDYFNPEKGKTLNYSQENSGLTSNKVLAILPHNKEGYWLGTWDGGLHYLNTQTGKINHIDGKYNKLTTKRKAGTINIFKIINYQPGLLWLATFGQGLLSYNIRENSFEEVIPASEIASFRDLIMDNQHHIWAASSSGLLHFLPGSTRYTRVSENSSLSLSSSALAIDRTHTLWLGSENGSVGKINSLKKNFNSFSYLHEPEIQSFNAISPILISGEISLAVNNKLILLNTHTSKYKSFTSPYSDLISLISLGTNGDLITASSDGLAIFNYNKLAFTKIQLDSNLSSRQIWTIYPENDSSFWIGALGTAYLIEVQKDKSVKLIKSLPTGKKGGISSSHYPACFLKDRRGNLWIGTFGGGLNLLEKNKTVFSHFEHRSGQTGTISDNFVECLIEDKTGRIWIGTHNGLDCYHPVKGTFSHINTAQGLQNSWISSLAEDIHGNIWISTHGGISCVSKNMELIRNYDKDDGLPSNSFVVRSAAALKNGNLWFGSNQGAVWFHPDSIRNNPFHPRVVVTDFRINNHTVAVGKASPLHENIELADKLKLSKVQNSFTFRFVALNYFNPRKNKYKYMLEGYDKSWKLAGEDRLASYTDIPSGNYNFIVLASNDDGIWSKEKTSISIMIAASFWRTSHAFLLYLLFASVLIYLFFKLRKKPISKTENNDDSLIPHHSPTNYLEVQPSNVIAESSEAVFLQKALKIVEENMSDPNFGVDEMCYKICISRSQLYRKIHASTGLSVTEFIKEIRLKRAAQLLKQKPDNISEIAYKVGFNDPKYFSKCFKQMFGVSPAQFITGHERLLPPQ